MKWPKRAVVICVAGVVTQVSAGPQRDAGRFLIDIEAKSMGSVRVNAPFPQLRKRFGANNVAKTTENLEGNPSTIVVVAVDGHKLVKHWNHVSTDDPAFKKQGTTWSRIHAWGLRAGFWPCKPWRG